jgi:hypothetical protein
MISTTTYTGGCLCGAVRYEAHGEPQSQGYCFCRDCHKASGSGFIPFLSFPADSVRFAGELQQSVVKSARGEDAVRNRCATCGSLIFGGRVGTAEFHTLYAGSLDDPSLFRPTMAIFARDKPQWVQVPPGLEVFATLPGM